ncbi:unnamed protein product [Closterium sp. NIES-53]
MARRLSLLLAALAALMLSACAPRAAAVRLPDASKAADHSCVQRKCGANAICVKERGDAKCICNAGFSMTPTGCVGAGMGAYKFCVRLASRHVLLAIAHVSDLFVSFLSLPPSLLHPSSIPPPSLLYPSSIPPPSLLHPSSIPPLSLLHPSSIPPPSLLHPSSIPPPSLLHPSSIPPPDTCVIKGCNAAVTDCVKDAAGATSCVCKTGYQNISGTCMGTFVYSTGLVSD